MGEAAPCLMRSVSHPLFASCEYKEDDPLRALTTSISFGRFMTEPLDWEKWSSFSHNRTLEDVQKHSRPGAVAEKKAFFEAHYKKIAFKKAAKSPKKENKPPNHSPQTNISPPRSDTHSDINETQRNDAPDPVFSHTDEIMSGSRQTEQEKASSKDVCSPTTDQVLAQFENIEDDVSSSCQVEQGKVSTENVSSEKHPFSRSSQVDKNVEGDVASSCQVEQGKVSTENVSSEKHWFSQSSQVDQNKKPEMKDSKPEICSSNSLSKNGTHKLLSCGKAVKKAARDVTEKKRSALQSLHMSMNFPNRTLKTISKAKDRLIQQPLNLKASVNGVKKNSPENRSHLNAFSVCTKKPRPSSSSTTTVTSSFSFRSEERAAKRKEFFQKLEEKGNNKETEKNPLQPKLKARNDNKKLRSSTNLEAKPCTNETKAPSNTQKVSSMQPCSPKLGGRKPILKSIQESCCQSPWRSLKPKNFIEINKKKLIASMASLPIKKMSKK